MTVRFSTAQFMDQAREYEDDTDAGERASEVALHRAFIRADEAIVAGTWQMVDASITSVVHSGVRTYYATINVEVFHD